MAALAAAAKHGPGSVRADEKRVRVYASGVNDANVDARVEDVIAKIEAHAAREPGGGLAFDGDGTLWSGDIGDDFFDAFLESDLLCTVPHASLVREAEAEGVPSHGTTRELARRIHEAYTAGAFPEERTCEIVTWISAGLSCEALDAFAARVMTDLALERRFHEEAVAIATWARKIGLSVYLVSASPRAIVAQAARVVGIDPACVVAATEAKSEAGVVEPAVQRPIPYGPGKVTRLREKLHARPLYAAFGDNAFDVPMLREAKVGVAVRPKPRLLARAAEVPGLTILARHGGHGGKERHG